MDGSRPRPSPRETPRGRVVTHRGSDPAMDRRLRDPVFAAAYRSYVEDLRRQVLGLTARRKRSPRIPALAR
jgi:hypothetical protein